MKEVIEKFNKFRSKDDFTDYKVNILKSENLFILLHYNNPNYQFKKFRFDLNSKKFIISETDIPHENKLLQNLFKNTFGHQISYKKLNYIILIMNNIPISFLSFVISNKKITLWNVCSDSVYKNSCQYTLYNFIIYILKFLKLEKKKYIELWVKENNKVAIHCYKNIGFEFSENISEDVRKQYGNILKRMILNLI